MREFARSAMFGRNIQMSSLNGKRQKVLDVGSGTSRRVYDFYPDADVTGLDKTSGWDIMELGLPIGNWDVIFANHVIEHLDDPDFFLDEAKAIMNEKTVLDIGTPNLCAWFNRILFLFGYLPHSYEVSYRKCYGRAFNWNQEETGGHVRVFSVPALIQMLYDHQFKIRSVIGEASFYPCALPITLFDRFISHVPSFASSFRILCTL